MNEVETKPYLSVVVPFYNEVENVERLWQILKKALDDLGKRYEVVLVDDGSSDGTRDVLVTLARQNPCLRVILFRANFGQSAAMAAGFAATRGQVVVAMDGDLQNDPNDIQNVIQKLEQDYDVVSGWRQNRQDKVLLRKIPSKIANKIICSVTNVKLHDTGCSLKAFRGDVLRRISLYGEFHRFIPALLRIEGARITELPVRHHARKFGKSKYNLSRTFRVIMDLTTISLLMRHLQNPTNFFAKFAAICFAGGMASFMAIVYKIYQEQSTAADLNILATVTVLLLASAFQFLCLGLIGKLVVESGERKNFMAELSENEKVTKR